MNRKSTALLLAVSLSLFGYIVIFEQGALTGADLEGRQSRLFERFARGRVDRIEISRAGETTILEKQVLEDGSIGEWQMLEPMETLADENAINALLGALEWSDARREFRADEGEAGSFGLSEPRVRVALRMGRETLNIAVGNDEEAGGGVYVSDDGGRTVKVAGLDVFEALDHGAEHFRTRRLAPGGVLTANALNIDGAETLALTKEGERWMAGGLYVSSAAVEEALDALTNLEAENYDAANVEPTLRVVARRPANGEVAAITFELAVGDGCEGAGEVSAQVTFDGEAGPLACVLDSNLVALRRPPSDWRELRPFTASNTDLRSLRLERSGEVLAIARGEDSEWSGSVAVDSDALDAWVQEMRRTRARDIVATQDFGAHGLEAPRATLTIVGAAGTEVVHIGSEAPEGLFARRNDEEGVVVLDPRFLTLLDVSGAAIRPRTLFEGESIEALTITREGVREVLEPAAGEDWSVVEPVAHPADRSGVRELIADLLNLEALRFIGAEVAEHELGAPALRVEFVAESEEGSEGTRHVLDIGAETADGRFARFDGGDVFILANVLNARLRGPLVSRDALSVPTYEIDGVRFEGEAGAWSMRQSEGHFLRDGEPVDDELAASITHAISRLRGRPIRYGEAAASEGFTLGGQRALLDVSVQGGETRRIRIGARDGAGAVFLRLDGLPVTFSVPEESLSALFEVAP